MKIYAINGSPRKKYNSATMLRSFVDGVKSAESEAEVEFINLYDYKYTGCISCFACQRKENREQLGCRIKDGISDICMACIHHCPQKAIQLTMPEKNPHARFCNEHIKLAEIIAANDQNR